MSAPERPYEVMLLPQMEVAACHCTLREADAWMRAYNEASRGPTIAVVARLRCSRGERDPGRPARRSC